MSTPPGTWRRRLANALLRHAARAMPAPQRHWAEAMRNEIAHVTGDREALRWAIGSVHAAHVARIRGLYLLDLPLVRGASALLAVFLAFDALLPTTLTPAYRAHAFAATDRLGRLTPGDDYHRLVPLMEAIPSWLHAISVAGGVCYLVALGCLLTRRRAAGLALLSGVGLQLAASTFVRPIVADVGVTAVPDPSLFAAVVLPVVLPLLVALAAWSGSRNDG